ncbi:signal peptidase II [Nitratireductor basaltis]|uniref:Lipoprotein signal peptidase n=1 Tax=Nitratireductor basaltis TaxID=472175 RepID=A0A084UEM1_9HYPH|nr:signal peptidase II [Nitratireductor basaltis]KFB11407.1 Lipoprotein signal peptidase [Nitratireductor basaltis]
MTRRQIAFASLLALIALLIDQWVKQLVQTNLPLHERVDLVPYLSLYHSQNTGVAFSMLSGVGGTWLSVLTLIVLGFILYLALKTQPHQRMSQFGFALIVGGALGNLVDRTTLGYVVDYIYFHTPSWSFAVFNLADAFITVGAGLVILDEIVGWLRGGHEPAE